MNTYLDNVTAELKVWKPTQMRNICRLILLKFKASLTGQIYPDDLEMIVENRDANVVGCAWRELMKHQLIRMMPEINRPSKRKSSRGRRVFAYWVSDWDRVNQWLAAHPLQDMANHSDN